ncbi:serine hydrolase [Altererythrobacter sp.]|nr:serine hydrolase [Altererythrobacter sp.]
MTLRHLLNHTSGIPNVTSFDDFGTVKYLPTTRDALIERFSSKDLEFAPGEQWKYSNSGYLMLSAVVEEVSGQSYAAFVQDNIFTPLEMTDTGIDSSAEILPKRASGYSPSEAGIVNADYVNMAIPQGAGAMYSTTHDLLKWQQGLFGGDLLQPASLEAYRTPIDLEARGSTKYALGVMVDETEEGTSIWHGGGIEGFNAWLGHDPVENITVVVLANLNGGTASSLGTNLMTLARGGELTLPSEREAVAVPAEQLEQYVGTYAVAPTFKIVVTQEDGSLKAQATGQSKFELFNEAEDLFFLKVVDAKLRFERDAEGTITGATLLQGGRETPATRE